MSYHSRLFVHREADNFLGGLVAALACTRTDAELKRLLVPELADRITACEDPFKVWWKRFRETGARFDSVSWARKVRL